MRGSHAFLFCFFPLLGIIPAGAGLTSPQLVVTCRPGDHPRGCGAHDFSRQFCLRCQGSSPRVRGSHQRFLILLNQVGIIPAGAGLTCMALCVRRLQWDHPRGCGAHCWKKGRKEVIVGSSPRVRGSLPHCPSFIGIAGIIPAGAGLTSHIAEKCRLIGDHPRGCGAHSKHIRRIKI